MGCLKFENNKMCCCGRYVMDKDKHKAKELRQVRREIRFCNGMLV